MHVIGREDCGKWSPGTDGDHDRLRRFQSRCKIPENIQLTILHKYRYATECVGCCVCLSNVNICLFLFTVYGLFSIDFVH